MLGLKIKELEITALTSSGPFSTKLSFNDGLNIIRANNSSGKSTCVNAIAFGLGLEAILGPSRKRPFPKSLYEVIYKSKSDQTPNLVQSSNVQLSIVNSRGEEAALLREIEGNSQKITVNSAGHKQDYFLGAAGEVGSAKSELGFHHWLAKFIGWILPDVVTFDGRETKLYLECIFPLFFIEQKRGWSEIQANIPTHYNIRNVKKNAAEFCLGFNSFEQEKKILILKSKVDNAENEWAKLKSTTESVADFNSVRVNSLPDLDKIKEPARVNFSYLENDIYISLKDQQSSLKKLIEKLNKGIPDNQPGNEKFESQAGIIRTLLRESENTARKIEISLLSLSDTDKKTITLRHDLNQYQQLRRLKSVGAEIAQTAEMSKCPICDSEMNDTLGLNSTQRTPMTLEENIEFLKNQIDFFSSIKQKTADDIQHLQASAKLIQSRLLVEQEKLNTLRSELDDINSATKETLRNKIQAEIKLKEVEKLLNSEQNFNEQMERIQTTWQTASNSLRLARKSNSEANKFSTISTLQTIIRRNLESFQFDYASINSISISNQTLRPEQEGYDIVAETSASDYIRIIWAYTLGLLELGGIEEEVKHGGFVVFDEPRQHEASKNSFISLIDTALKSKSYGGQVIFATSMEKSELYSACKDKDLKVYFFDDYILKPSIQLASSPS